MIFASGMYRKVLAGVKSEIRVPALDDRPPVREGREYGVQPAHAAPSVARIRIVAVSWQLLGTITPASIKREGFASRLEMERWWVEQHGDFDPAMPVWAIVFMLADAPLLLAADSTRGYTHDPRLALQHEPEAVDPEEIPTYASSVEAQERYAKMHADEQARAALRSQMGRLREKSINLIKRGKDPTPVLENAVRQLDEP